VTPPEVVKALDLIADYYSPRFGRWAYHAFDAINAAFFAGRLPRPLIQWALTPHGHCLGLTAMRDPPIITLHPSIMEPRGDAWGIDPAWFGVAYAFDVLLHESIHVAQHALYGPAENTGQSSHNCPSWIAEVNRIAPLLGLDGVEAGRSTTKRVQVAGQFTATGKPLTRVVRASRGNLPHKAVARFPGGVREWQGSADAHYRRGELPGGIRLDCNF
jgi:hypothetical protein